MAAAIRQCAKPQHIVVDEKEINKLLQDVVIYLLTHMFVYGIIIMLKKHTLISAYAHHRGIYQETEIPSWATRRPANMT